VAYRGSRQLAPWIGANALVTGITLRLPAAGMEHQPGQLYLVAPLVHWFIKRSDNRRDQLEIR
jgi:hypothetical protein